MKAGSIMNTRITALAEQALALLPAQHGMSKKETWMYKQYGFKPILQHFKQKGIAYYSQAKVDSFVNVIRTNFEKGNLMKWKWTRIRKASVFLASLYANGALDMTPLLPWEVEQNPLHKKPSANQLDDADNIFAIVYRIKIEMQKFNLSHDAFKNYVYYGFDPLLRYFKQNKTEKYDTVIVQKFLCQRNKLFEKGTIHEEADQKARKVVWMIEEYRKTGTVRWHYQPRLGFRPVSPHYAEIWDKFQGENEGVLSELSLDTIKSNVRRFMLVLEDKGIHSFNDVSHHTVGDCISQMAAHFSGGQNSLLFSLRIFLRFLKKSGTTDIDLSIAVPDLTIPRRTIQSGFSEEELARLLNSPNVDTPVGKRDFAIMMTAVQTGLRAIDIKNLKRTDIDWRSNEIRIVQHKTKRPLSLPLRPEAGNAIVDYLLNGRPESDLPYIFLCATQPARPIGNYTISRIITDHMLHAGVPKKMRRGSHSFRRTFGKNLLEAEIPLDMLSELLGHTHSDSSRPYLSMNEKELKLCGLSLSSVEKAGEIS
jgi:site-specific recombinase XerD